MRAEWFPRGQRPSRCRSSSRHAYSTFQTPRSTLIEATAEVGPAKKFVFHPCNGKPGDSGGSNAIRSRHQAGVTEHSPIFAMENPELGRAPWLFELLISPATPSDRFCGNMESSFEDFAKPSKAQP